MKSKKSKTKKEIPLIEYLEKITRFKRKKHYPEIHEVHKKYNISKQTLFYVKEYGKNANVSKTIIKESIKILLLASVISSFGGLALEQIKTLFLSIMPLLILLPSLNNMIGNYGTIISSRFSTMLHEGEIKEKWKKNRELKKLFSQMTLLTIIGAVLSSLIAIAITYFSGGILFETATKVFFIVLIDMFILTNVLFFVATRAGIYIYKKKEDPNNFLIPITTSVADFTNMVVLAVLIILLF